MNEISACPFCGGQGEVKSKDHGDGELAHFIVCRSCACEGPWYKHPGNAIRMWNKRTPSPSDMLPAFIVVLQDDEPRCQCGCSEPNYILATRTRFQSRDAAQRYADSCHQSRKPLVVDCPRGLSFREDAGPAVEKRVLELRRGALIEKKYLNGGLNQAETAELQAAQERVSEASDSWYRMIERRLKRLL